MPEGPEIYLLSKALNNINFKTASYGKHLYFLDHNEDWSFGLSGKVTVEVKNGEYVLTKYMPNLENRRQSTVSKFNFIYGNITNYNSFDELKQQLGPDFLTADEQTINEIVDKISQKKTNIFVILKDQQLISGIGKYWAEVILDDAGIIKTDRTNLIDKTRLARSIIKIRNQVLELYNRIINETSDKLDLVNRFYFWCKFYRSNTFASKDNIEHETTEF